MRINDEIRRLMLERAPSNLVKQAAMKNGMQTLRDAGIKKLIQGVTSVEEIVSITVADSDML